jgi:DNA anti-recombination protein RmuC
LGGRREGLKQDLEKHRIDYENKRKQLVEKTEAIRARMSDVKGKSVDDALDLRKHACEELSRAVSETVEKLLKEENSQNVEGTEQTV